MTHWRTARAASGDNPQLGPHLAPGAQRDSIPSEYLFPRGGVVQTLIDIATIAFAVLFVGAAGIGVAFALFVLLFVAL